MKMHTYKLTYFDLRARGECARQIFAQAGVPYEDVRIPLKSEKWTEMKSGTPFGQLPLLEVDGKETIAQSMTINRYLARQFGLAGKTPFEEALVDSLADWTVEYQNSCFPWLMILAGFAQGDKDEKFRELVIPARDKFFSGLQKFLKKSAFGFLVGRSVTWVDLLVSEMLAAQANAAPEIFDGYGDIEKYVKHVRDLPNIKKWLAKRPQNHF